MSNLHRIQWIDAQIRAGNYPNARTLAEAFEISRRQALRDFEYLRDSLGAPLEYCAERRGYRYATEAFTLPGPYVTEAQRTMLTHLADYYGDLARRDSRFSAMYAEMASLFSRLGRPGPTGSAAAGESLPLRVPFRALIRFPDGASLPPPGLKPYWRGLTPTGQAALEFHDPTALLAALLGCLTPFRIEWPRWLRERLQTHLRKLQSAQDEVTPHVTPPLVSSSHQPSPQRRTQAMTEPRKTTSARYTPAWNSYCGAAHGVLTAAGMFDGDLTQLMGMTSMAFHLIMHEECCVSSATVYDWMEEHQSALERLGVLSELYIAMPDAPTYDAARRRAVEHIKAAIDRGVGVILWGVDTGEFGVVTGYDDADGVFLTDGCFGGREPILYENLGKSFEGAPILHYQIPVERVDIDPARAYRHSLAYYVAHMERPHHVAPDYKTGLLAYANWLRALEAGKFQHFGLRYNSAVIAEGKEQAARYLAFLAETWDPALQPAAEQFRRVADAHRRINEALGHDLDGCEPDLNAPVTDAQVKALLPLVREARDLDAQALALVKAFLAR